MEAFITGSRAYGTAKPDSDLDLCVLMDDPTMEDLVAEYGWPIKIGSLNIIPCTSELEMLAWRKAREVCIAGSKSGPLTKEAVIEIHEAWRKQYGVPERDMGDSGTAEERENIAEAKREARENRIGNPVLDYGTSFWTG